MRRFPFTVTFQEPTEVRDAAGGVDYTYANVTDLTDLPAHIVPLTQEERGERMVTTEELYNIIVQGDREVEVAMAVLTSEGVFDVLRVDRPPQKLRQVTLATLVVAERVAI